MNDSSQVTNSENITTAVLLAAGTGTRLQPLTLNAPKCLTEVGGISILQRLIENLREQGFKRLVIVTGHLGDCIEEYLRLHAADLQIDYVFNPDYRTTNNIYSLWLARTQIKESFLLVESDLVFETPMLDNMLQPNKMAVSTMLPWMNGTTVEMNSENRVITFNKGEDICDYASQYKTVNIYSISLDSWAKIDEQLGCYVSEGKVNDYYEVVLAEMVANGSLAFDAVFFDAGRWYEIDTRADLIAAENLVAKTTSSAGFPLKSADLIAEVA